MDHTFCHLQLDVRTATYVFSTRNFDTCNLLVKIIQWLLNERLHIFCSAVGCSKTHYENFLVWSRKRRVTIILHSVSFVISRLTIWTDLDSMWCQKTAKTIMLVESQLSCNVVEKLAEIPLDDRMCFWWCPLFSTSTFNCIGMVSIVGILYVHVPSEIVNPSSLIRYSSCIKNPIPWTKAPSICKKNIAGHSDLFGYELSLPRKLKCGSSNRQQEIYSK